ncbi:ABC transporter permease [Rhizobium miluonense]|uniref:Amino acid ABC transporter membrane protein 2, PAAT family (TC 3.A.1.3.-) n=1 Tax=Rhizobium miluonense TaxID=411945 RepID=A0A1C3V1Q0_9HYPH|nr:ABC transporter permease subunit [Rhizobium miluonense]SCB21690.1 amino acid ABC transporter membrane protein 2, PAAT family (TC 3.A.1.3.-) [Rhizobium miluonense]
MDINLIVESISVLAHGVFLTLALTLLSLVISFILSVPLSLLRASPNRALSGSVLAYTYVFRGTPLMVQLFLVYYGLSQLAVVRQSILWPLLREPFWCALAAFSLNSTAYTTEVFRAGILAVPRGIVEAAQALGLSRLMQIRLIIFPLAFRTVLPSYANEVIGLVKASSLASTVTLLEITGLARRMVSETFAPYEVFLAAGLLYLLLNFIVSAFFRMLEMHLARSPTSNSRNIIAGPMASRLLRLRKAMSRRAHTKHGNQPSTNSP